MAHTQMLKPQNLTELIGRLHQIFDSDKIDVEEVKALLQSYQSNSSEWGKYAKFDQFRYTRNLVDEGNGKFNLMILCWGEGHGSAIHDHTNSHCFLKILQGNLKETLFNWPDAGKKEMVKRRELILEQNQSTYMSDTIGLHRVENVSHTEPAVSLHLYSPPFDQCQCYDQRTGHKNTVKMTFWSKFGERNSHTSVCQENN